MPPESITADEAAALVRNVYALVCACPAGRATTYGWLGAALGFPRGARMVGWILNDISDRSDVPAHRVVNAKGELTGSWAFGQRGRMRALLEAEGVPFGPDDRIDTTRYGWNPATALSAAARAQLLAAAANDPVAVSAHLLHLLLDDPASPFRPGASPAERPTTTTTTTDNPTQQQNSLWE